MHHNTKGGVRESEKSELTDRGGGVSCSSMKKPLYTLEHPPQTGDFIHSECGGGIVEGRGMRGIPGFL